MKKTIYTFLFLLPLLAANYSATAQQKYYVKTTGNNTLDGKSWANAKQDLQAIVNASASGDTVFVAAGTYTGGFYMKDGVQVYGGFSGSETYTTQSKPSVNVTMLDGNNTQRVLTQPKAFTTPTVWSGFTLQHGKAQAYMGAVVYNIAGTAPAGILCRYDAATGGGYMVSLNEVEKPWGANTYNIPGLPNVTSDAIAQNGFSGAGNTVLIVKRLNAGNYAAYWCDTLTAGGFTNWYLPACGELYGLWEQKAAINTIFKNMGVTLFSDYDSYYWASLGFDGSFAWRVMFDDGVVQNGYKGYDNYVRAFHAFNSFGNLDNLVFAGGGVLLFNNGVLRNCVVTDNQAVGQGGGIYAAAGAQVQGCLVKENQAGSGSGLYLAGTAQGINNTIANNKQNTDFLDNRPAAPQIGDFYYTDGSYSTGTATPATDKELVGVVCSLNPTNSYSGVVLNIQEVVGINWADANTWVAGLTTAGHMWRQPLVDELQAIYSNKANLNTALSKIAGATLSNNWYWSGSEYNANLAWSVSVGSGVVYSDYKSYNFAVRAVLAFNLFTYLNDLKKEALVLESSSAFSNSIVWGNQDKDGAAANLAGAGTVSYSCVEGGSTTNNNIADDPLFVSATDYHLQVTSPCLNTGNASLVPVDLVADIDGKPRTAGTTADMGAYQIPQCTPPVIITQPVGSVYGAVAKVSVAATGTGPTYQWYKDGISTSTADTCLVSGAGKYNVVITGTCGTLNSDTAAITKATPTLTLQAETVTYTGNALHITPITAQGVVGTVNPTDFAPTYSYTIGGNPATASAQNAGTYSVTTSITGDANHNGVASTAVTYTVNKATPVINLTAKNANYSGSPININAPTITGSTTASTLPITYEYTGTGSTTYGSSNTPPTNAGSYSVTVSTVGDANHNTASATTTLSIGVNTPILSLTGKSATYTGSPIAMNTVGIQPAEAQHLAVTYNYSGTQLDGTNYPVTTTAPTNAGNYTVEASVAGDANFAPASVVANLDIIKKAANINMENRSIAYTGSPVIIDAPVTEPATATLTITYQGIGATVYTESTTAPTNGGNYLVKADFLGNNNYTTASATANLTITDAGSPTLLLNNETVTYNGVRQAISPATIQTVTAQYLTIRYSYANAGYGPSATPPTVAGVYTVTATTTADVNFTAGSVTARLTIDPKPITVTALGGSSTYGESPANPGFTATGLVNGETQSVLTGLSNSFGIDATTPPGTYTLSVVGTLTNGNYTIGTSNTGIWIVNPIITASAGANCSITPSSISVVNHGDDLIYTFSANPGYQISQVLIDGVNDPVAVSTGSYTFTDVQANHTIHVIASVIPVVITSQPAGGSICRGGEYTFAVTAIGENLSYQWYKGNDKIQGATTNTYKINNAEISDYNLYSVVVSNPANSVYSEKVRLWVAEPLPATLTFAEVPTTAIVGREYKVSMSGYPDVTKYAWSYSGSDARFNPESGTKNETSVVFAQSGTGTLSVEMEHVCGTRTATQAIEVKYPTGIDNLDSNLMVSPNPTSGIIKIPGTIQSSKAIRIYSLSGKLMKIYDAQDGETTIDLSAYVRGTYLVQYNGKTTKVIKK